MDVFNACLLGAFRFMKPFPSRALPTAPRSLQGPRPPPALLAYSSAAVKATLNINTTAPALVVTSIPGLLGEGRGCLSKVKQ